jgi:hypothetical protein
VRTESPFNFATFDASISLNGEKRWFAGEPRFVI